MICITSRVCSTSLRAASASARAECTSRSAQSSGVASRKDPGNGGEVGERPGELDIRTSPIEPLWSAFFSSACRGAPDLYRLYREGPARSDVLCARVALRNKRYKIDPG